MPFEKSAGAVIFRKNEKIEYLLLHYPSSAKAAKDYWDFPKGHIEEKETIGETVKREVKEETGLENIAIISGFKEWIKYFFKFEGKNIFKIVTYLLAKTNEQKVRISPEHTGYKWLPYQSAMEELSFKNAKEILKKANEFLIKNEMDKNETEGKF